MKKKRIKFGDMFVGFIYSIGFFIWILYFKEWKSVLTQVLPMFVGVMSSRIIFNKMENYNEKESDKKETTKD